MAPVFDSRFRCLVLAVTAVALVLAGAAEDLSRSSDPFPGSYRVRGLTTDVMHGDTRRIEDSQGGE